MKKGLFFLGLLLALCTSYNLSAQTLLFDAAKKGVNFEKVDGNKDYVLNLGGNQVENGTVIMTTGAKAVSIALSPSIKPTSGGGVTVVMLVSNVDVTKGGQFISLRQTSTSGHGGLKIKSGTTDGTLHATWQDGEWGNGAITSGKFPTDGEKQVVSYTYLRTDANGTGSTFYINKESLGSLGSLVSGNNVSEIALGGLSSASSTFLNVGMHLHRVQVYEGQLSPSQVATAADNIKLPVERNELTEKMAEVMGVINSSLIGNNPGQYAQENLNTLQAALDRATQVMEGEPTEEEIAAETALLDAAKATFLASINQVKLSTAEQEVWYYINGVISYAADKSITMNTAVAGGDINFSDQTLNPAKLFKFEDAGNGRVSLKNFATGKYIGGNGKVSNSAAAFNLTYLGEDAQYTLNAPGSNPLHAQNNNSLLVTYAGGLNTGSAWRLIELPAEEVEKPVTISHVSARQGFTVTGIGNLDHPLMYATIDVEGIVGSCTAKSITLDFTGTSSTQTINKVKVYKIPAADLRFKAANAVLLGEAVIENNQVEVLFTEEQLIESGTSQWAITVDVNASATEGALIKGTLVDIDLDNATYAVNSAPEFPTQVFLTQSIVVAAGDYGSLSYRIPATAVADDGSIIAVTDKRIGHSGDLPANIDLIVQRSTDNGKTWSDPIIIAGGENSLTSNGFGDPAIIKDRTNGKLIILCVAGPGFWTSTPAAPSRVEYFESTDNGVTWSKNRDITSMVYGSASSNATAAKWEGVFPASGRMLQLRSGRIISALLVRNPVTGGNDNFMMYSDDSGLTWDVSTSMAVKGGDEAKLTQRNDGKVIISSRQGGGRIWNVSNDTEGANWTQSRQTKRTDLPDVNCNGEIMTYTSTLDGYDKDRMIHSLCVGPDSRKNVSMTISYDEGTNWSALKSICPTASAYSTFDILPDGTIGMYYEDRTHGGTDCEMVFVRFSLDWLTEGADSYTPPIETSIDGTQTTPISVSVVNRKIVVTGTQETPQVFTTAGAQVNPKSSLGQGVYVVSVAGTSTKVVVK